jgi:hypothetical protein
LAQDVNMGDWNWLLSLEVIDTRGNLPDEARKGYSKKPKYNHEVVHFNIFVLAHKNANEPAGFCRCGRNPAELRQLCVMADVIGFVVSC